MTGLERDGNITLEYFIDSLKNTSDTFSDLKSFSATDITEKITDLATSYIRAELNDIFDDNASVTWFNMLARRSLPGACTTNPRWRNDSLVPSTSNESLAKVSCQPGVSVVNCTNFANCRSGCINLYDVMASSQNLSDFQSKIAVRYNMTPACVTNLTYHLSINYDNWYLPRVSNTTGIGWLLNRWLNNGSAIANKLKNDFASFTTNLDDIATGSIKDKANGLVDRKTGIIASMNCSVLGSDLRQTKDAFCANVDWLVGEFVASLLLSVLALLFLLTLRGIHCLQVPNNNAIQPVPIIRVEQRMQQIEVVDRPDEQNAADNNVDVGQAQTANTKDQHQSETSSVQLFQGEKPKYIEPKPVPGLSVVSAEDYSVMCGIKSL